MIMAQVDPEVVNTATKSILDVGVVGAICILLIIVVIVRERWWQNREKEITAAFTAEIKSVRAAHDETTKLMVDEVRKNGDLVATYRAESQRQGQIFDTVVDALVKLSPTTQRRRRSPRRETA